MLVRAVMVVHRHGAGVLLRGVGGDVGSDGGEMGEGFHAEFGDEAA